MRTQEAGGARGWMALYGLTALLEAPVMLVRYVTALAAASVAVRVVGGAGAGAWTWAMLALAPTVWSLASLASAAPGGWLWRERMGGRRPSRREADAREDAMRRLRAAGADGWAEPRRWFVVDLPEPHAAVRGDTLMLTRGALESRYLPALLAHEMGHMAGMDARLMAAVEHLEVGGSGSVGAGGVMRAWLALLRGGWGVRAMAPAWGEMWREAEYGADAYAARLGEAEALAQFLELHALGEERAVRWAWLKGQPRPPVALRVERLRATARPEGEAAEGAEDEEAREVEAA